MGLALGMEELQLGAFERTDTYESINHSVVSNPATPWTVVCQAPLAVGFSEQEY